MSGIERKRSYKKLIDRGNELHKELSTYCTDSSGAVNEVSDLITRSNELNMQTNPNDYDSNAAEAVMDAQVIKMGHEILGEIVNKVCTSEFSMEEYCVAIHPSIKNVSMLITLLTLINYGSGYFQQGRFAGNSSIDWETLAGVVAMKFAAHKSSCCLLGSFKNEPPEIVQKLARVRQPKSSQSKLVTPENVTQLESEAQTGKNLNIFMSKLLKVFLANKKQPIPYYKLIIDPSDFMQTIDNAFQVAFLVSNRTVAIEEGDDGMPMVRPVLDKSENRSNKVPVQAVSNITMKICQDMAKRYNIKEPLLR